MKKAFLKVFLFILVAGCKSQQMPKKVTFLQFAQKEIESGVVSNNPLVIYNGKPLGKFSDLDYSLDLFSKNISEPSSFPKGSHIMVELFGSEAIQGVLSFEDQIVMYCEMPPPTLYILNDNFVDLNEFAKVKWKNVKKFSFMNSILNKEGTKYIYQHIYSIYTK